MMSNLQNRLCHKDWPNPLRDAMPEAIGADTEVKNVVDAIGASGCEPDTSLAC
jgi:hypothetical protein